MDAFDIYATCTAAWCCAQAIPVLIHPSLAVWLLGSGNSTASNITDFQSASLRGIAVLLIFVAAMSLYLAGTLPSFSTRHIGFLLSITLVTHTCAFIYSYTSFNSYSNFAHVPGVLIHGILLAWGIWCGVFGTGTGSEPTRGSSWLFSNQEKRAKRVEKREKKWAKVDKVK